MRKPALYLVKSWELGQKDNKDLATFSQELSARWSWYHTGKIADARWEKGAESCDQWRMVQVQAAGWGILIVWGQASLRFLFWELS